MSPIGGMPELFSVVFSLLVILAFLMAVAYLARRWRVTGRIGGQSGSGAIRIVASQAVGWQSSLQIVEADGQRFLIAAGRGGITSVGRLTSGDNSIRRPMPGSSDRQPESST